MEIPNITCSQKIPYSEHGKHLINAEIEKNLPKAVIIKCEREDNEFISIEKKKIHSLEKKSFSFRTILSLNCLSKFINTSISRWSF